VLPSLGTLLQGVEIHDPPFSNSAGRSDIRGCCWWGRGALQVRGVCSYGKLNHWLGAKAIKEGRKALYPDIDFCTNPGAICSDKRTHELRWVTGMFHWAQTMQKDKDYFNKLQEFVDGEDYKNDKSFINLVNEVLGGTEKDVAKRTEMFHHGLRAFNLIPVETNSTILPIGAGLKGRYCGLNWNDARSKCEPCYTNFDCTGATLCHAGIEACKTSVIGTPDSESTNTASGVEGEGTNTQGDVADTPMAMAAATTLTTNYCGKSWGDAAATCAKACPSGIDGECALGEYCFGDITTCSSNTIENVPVARSSLGSNYCGASWSDAYSKCSASCPGGTDVECPLNQYCFGDIQC